MPSDSRVGCGCRAIPAGSPVHGYSGGCTAECSNPRGFAPCSGRRALFLPPGARLEAPVHAGFSRAAAPDALRALLCLCTASASERGAGPAVVNLLNVLIDLPPMRLLNVIDPMLKLHARLQALPAPRPRGFYTSTELAKVIGRTPKDADAQCLRLLGWVRVRRVVAGKLIRAWVPPSHLWAVLDSTPT
jgi:hypothetical protein